MQILDYCREFPKQSFSRGEIVMREGDWTNRVYVLIEGAVEITREGVVLNRVNEPGAIFGEVSALIGTPHMATVRAIDCTRFYMIAHAREFVRCNPEISFHLCITLAQRFTSVSKSLACLKRSVDTLMKTEVQLKPTAAVGDAPVNSVPNEDGPRILRCGVVDKEAQALCCVKR